jgi:large subunit ribosomal protein L14e
MTAIEVGSVCKKLTGREAGRYCVVIAPIDESYIMITGPRNITNVRRRQCNILHLEPTGDKLDIRKDASDADVEKALKKAKLIEKVEFKAPH